MKEESSLLPYEVHSFVLTFEPINITNELKLVRYFTYSIQIHSFIQVFVVTAEVRASSSCLDVAKEARSRASQSPISSWAGLQFPVGHIHRLLRKGNYAERVGAGARPFTWLPSWSTWPQKSWSWPAMLPVTTTRPELSPVICNWPSATMRN